MADLYPDDPLVTMPRQEPRSLRISTEPQATAQTVGVAVADIPSRLIGGAGIRVTAAGLTYAIDLDIAELTVVEGGSPANQWVPVWVGDQPATQVRRVPVNAIPADAPFDGHTYGRRDGAWYDTSLGIVVNWGDIDGKPSTFPPAAHTHPESEITGLVSDLAALQNGVNTNTTRNDTQDTLIAGKEPTIAAGTVSQYWRGDKSWQTLPTPAPFPEAPTNGAIYGRRGSDASWQTVTGGFVSQTGAAGAANLPTGTTAQRPTPVTGQIRFNSDLSIFEGYNGTAWASIGTPGGVATAGFRNALINGDFRVQQRPALAAAAGARYGQADRWLYVGSGSTIAGGCSPLALGQVPYEPKWYMQAIVASVAGANNYAIVSQRIEGVRSLAGQQVTLSFWASSDAPRPMSVELVQNFGTGGSPSAIVTGIGATKFGLTTTMTRYSVTFTVPPITGKTIGSNNDDWLEVYFWLDAGSSFAARSSNLGQQSGVFAFSQVQLEPGPVATPPEQRLYAIELQLCQRYYFATPSNAANFNYVAYMPAGQTGVIPMMLPVVMRILPAPTVTGTWTTSNCSTPVVTARSPQTFDIGAVATALGMMQFLTNTAVLRFDAEL